MADLWLTHLPWVTRRSWRSPYPVHAGLSFFPSARQTAAPRVVVNHSTETLGLPGYNGGAAAPHLTGSLETGQVWQHVPLNWGSRCLAVSAGGIRDLTVNVTGVIQIEWIGAVTPGYPDRYGHYDIPRRFPDDGRAQGFVARLWRAIHDATGIPLDMSSYATWVSYPASYGARASQRLTSPQFRDARGMLGHQHVPANDHGDGLLGRAVRGRAVDMEETLRLARTGITLPDTPAPAPDLRRGFTQAALDHAEAMLDALGIPGADVWAKTLAYQQAADLTEDGLPGPDTTTALEADMATLQDIATVTLRGPAAAVLGVTPGDYDLGWVLEVIVRNAVQAKRYALAAMRNEVDPGAVADALREDVTRAVTEAGSGATADQIVDALLARLTATDQEG